MKPLSILFCVAAAVAVFAEERGATFIGPAEPPSMRAAAPPPPPPTWAQQAESAAGQAFQAAGDAGNFATGFGDPAAAAGQSLEAAKGPHTRHSVRDQLVQNGQIQMDKNGVYRDKATRKVVSRKTLDKTAKKMNQFDADLNRMKQSKPGRVAKGGLDKLGKFGELGEWSQTAGTAGGELAGGDYVGAAKTGANHVLSNSAEAAGGYAGAQGGAALGGLVGGPPGALVGGLLGGAGGAMGGGQLYDKYGKPVVEGGYDALAEQYYGDKRGKDAQGRADIAAEQELLDAEGRARLEQMNRMKKALTPEAFETWKKVWGPRLASDAPELNPLRPVESNDAFRQAMDRLRENAAAGKPVNVADVIDPDGALATREKDILARITALEREVARDVASEEAHVAKLREQRRQEELEKLRQEQAQIEAERQRRAQEAAQTMEAIGSIIGAIGQSMSQPPYGSAEPMQPSGSPSQAQPSGRRGHVGPDGRWHEGGN